MPLPVLAAQQALRYVASAIALNALNWGIDAVVGAAGKAVCDAYKADPYAGFGKPAVDGMVQEMCGGYWAATDDLPPTWEVPFQGGQCPIRYNVEYVLKFNSTDTRCVPGGTPQQEFYCDKVAEGVQGNILGPLQAPVFTQNADGTASARWYGVNATQTGSSNRIFNVSTSSSGVRGFYTLQSSDISPANAGNSDNCGNIAPQPRPNPPGTGPGRWGETSIIIAPEVNLPIEVTPIGIQVNLDGSVNILVDVGGVTIDLAGGDGGNGDGSGGGGDGVPPGGGGLGGGSGIVGGGPGAPSSEEFPEPPEGKEWIGCVIECEIPSRYGKIPGSAPVEVLPAVIGNARLWYRTDDLGFSEFVAPNHQIREAAFTLIRQHKGLTVRGVYVNLPEDVSVLITPIYADKETETQEA